MSHWKILVSEAHKRSLWQVLGIYALASWGVLQVVLALYEALGLPQWVPPVTVTLLIIGLPVVLATAFVQKRLPRPQEVIGRHDYDPTLHPNLDGLAEEQSAASPVARLLTWRRSIVAGVAAFTLFASGTTGFVALQRRGTLIAQGLVASDSPVLLADFANTSRDTTLGQVVTEALRVDLQQSNVVRLAQAAEIEDALRRMQRTPAQGLPESVARDLAEREGMRAIISGQVSSIGGGYVITSTVISADSGRTLAAFKAEAKDSTQLISAVNDLSKQVRQKIGESVRSVRGAMPLEKATTASLPALRKYTEGMAEILKTGDRMRGIALMRDAVAIDSTFASAWRGIGVTLSNMGVRPVEMDTALTRAYTLSERLPQNERYATKALYMELVRGDDDSAIVAYQQILATDSTDDDALIDLSALYIGSRKFTEAEPLLQRATRFWKKDAYGWQSLIDVQLAQGKVVDAQKTIDAAEAILPNNYDVRSMETQVIGDGDRWDRVDSVASAIAAAFPQNASAQLDMLRVRISAAQGLGHFEKARALAEQLHDKLNDMHFPGMALLASMDLADQRFFAGDSPGAVRQMDAALREHPLESFPPGIGPETTAALDYSQYGAVDKAVAVMDVRRKRLGGADEVDHYIREVIAARRAPSASSAATIQKGVAGSGCPYCRVFEVAGAYDAAGAADSARAAFERYMSFKPANMLSFFSLTRPYVLYRLGQLYDRAGDKPHAIERYSEFVRLWSTADPELQPRVIDAKKRILALQGAG